VEPEYPEQAKRARLQGIVILMVTLDEEGKVADMKVIRGDAAFTDAALAAVRQWKYSPTLVGGEPVPVIATVTVPFVLR